MLKCLSKAAGRPAKPSSWLEIPDKAYRWKISRELICTRTPKNSTSLQTLVDLLYCRQSSNRGKMTWYHRWNNKHALHPTHRSEVSFIFSLSEPHLQYDGWIAKACLCTSTGRFQLHLPKVEASWSEPNLLLEENQPRYRHDVFSRLLNYCSKVWALGKGTSSE